MDYKTTLNLPQTPFPMKADLGAREPKFLEGWEKLGLYQKILAKNGKKPRFIFHDGPPYANGHIHYGTILNKILKDIVVKYKNMAGFSCPFIPGWDCHGLPIELEVDKELGSKKAGMSPLQIRKHCRDYASKYVDIQRKEFKRLGCLGDWENPYLTMSPEYEATIVRELGRLVEKNLLYRGKKPVFWCPSCRTALAEAEVEYQDHQSPSIYVKFRVMEEEKIRKLCSMKGNEPIFILIWTTTPWTLPANLGVALHPQLSYAALRVHGEIWIIADGLLETFLKATGSPDVEDIWKFGAKDLEKLHCRHPFLEKNSLILLAPHVTLDAGTGCVHTAPGHGQEDYEVGKKYGLEPFSPVDAAGRFTQEAGVEELTGKKVEEANKAIIELLKKKGALLQEETITHSYPHCGRCKKPILFRATEQWFLSMERGNLRQEALKQIHAVDWIPHWGVNRITGMIQARPDWCISRQRIWGVPIIALNCTGCLEVVISTKMVEKAAEIFRKEGSDAWYADEDVSKFLPEGFSCPKCGGKRFAKRSEILDVWFDSGVSYAHVLEERCQLKEPADLYLEGSDQHRGWFHTSLLESVATRGKAPYKRVLTHGFVVDSEGKKLSKSAKNFIPPENVLKNHGAEMLRLWVADEDYRNDIRFSEDILNHLVDSYRKIRNTCRYLLGNLYDFHPGKDDVPFEKLSEPDRWILHSFSQVIRKVHGFYENFEFHMIAHALTRFCAVELSSFYLDVLKDRLYTEAKEGLPRRSAQTVLFQILDGLVRLMAPILSFTAEEVWQSGPAFEGKPETVFLSSFPEVGKSWENGALGERWERFLRMRGVVTKALEMARKEKFLGNSLQACVVLEASPDQEKFLKSFGDALPDLFLVSEAIFGKASGEWTHESEEVVGFKVGVKKASGSKCSRCWKYLPAVGKNPNHPELCGRCVNVLQI